MKHRVRKTNRNWRQQPTGEKGKPTLPLNVPLYSVPTTYTSHTHSHYRLFHVNVYICVYFILVYFDGMPWAPFIPHVPSCCPIGGHRTTLYIHYCFSSWKYIYIYNIVVKRTRQPKNQVNPFFFLFLSIFASISTDFC